MPEAIPLVSVEHRKMIRNMMVFILVSVLLGCTSAKEKTCLEEADVAETVMKMRLKYGQIANTTYFLTGNNTELQEQLRPIIHDAFEYSRGGLATYESTQKKFREKYYQQCMDRQDH